MTKNGKVINCQNCNKEFYASLSRINSGTKYCSKNCSLLHTSFQKGKGYWLGKKRPDLLKTKASKSMFKKGSIPWNLNKYKRLPKPCIGCKKVFLVRPSQIEKIKWCSRVCRINHSKYAHIKIPCPKCNKVLIQKRSKLCRSCTNIGISRPFCAKENNWNWKGGITPENQRIRHTPEYILWRKSVFERDNFTCQLCGKKGQIIHADHIKSFSNYPELRLNIDNGRTLCVECHKKTPNYMGKARWETL
jgi:hypothetical protein